jgi:integrase
MPRKTRFKTNYAGVYYIEVEGARGPEKVYYIQYRRNGKLIEEKAGSQFKNDMTPARAAGVRAARIDGREPTNAERRAAKKAAKEAEAGRCTLVKLWESYKKQKPDSKGLRTDASRFSKYLQPTLGHKEPQEIAPLDVDRIRLKASKGHADQTVKHILVLLKRIVQYGVDKNLCTPLPFKVKPPKVDNEKTEFLSGAEVAHVLKTLNSWPDRQAADMLLLAMLTGLRRGELYKLEWNDIDIHRGFIYIRDPKGGKSQHVPLNAAAANLLLKNHPRISDIFVFSHADGRPFTDTAHNYRQLKELRAALKLPEGFRPLHGLRHHYASALASSGQVDLYTLQKLLAHKSPLMTQRYAHLRDEALRRASELAGEIIEAAKAKKETSNAF